MNDKALSVWFRAVLDEANLLSVEREKVEADFNRCLRWEVGRDLATRYCRTFALLNP